MNKTVNEICQRIKDIHDKKSKDYAAADNPYSNFERAATLASWFSNPIDKVFAVLIGVKLARLAELRTRNKIPANESIEDSFLDLNTYTVIWHAYYLDHTPFNLVKKDMQDGMDRIDRELSRPTYRDINESSVDSPQKTSEGKGPEQ